MVKQKIMLAILLIAAVVVSGCVSDEAEETSSATTDTQGGFTQINTLEAQISDKADEVDAIRAKIDRRGSSLLTSSNAALNELLRLNSDLQKNLGEFDVLLGQEQKIISDMSAGSSLAETEMSAIAHWDEANKHFLYWSNYERMASQNTEKILSFLKLYNEAIDHIDAADKDYNSAVEKLDKRDQNGATNALAAAQKHLSAVEDILITANHAINFEFNNKIIASIRLTNQAYGEYILTLLPGKSESYSRENTYSAYEKHMKDAKDILPTEKTISEETYFWKHMNVDSVYDKADSELRQAKKSAAAGNTLIKEN